MTTLKRASFAGSVWVGSSVVVAAIAQLLQTATVARVLTPIDVGVVAAGLVLLTLADTIANMGIANSIVARQRTSSDELSSLYWFNALVGIVVAAILYISTPVFVWFFRMPELEPLVHVVALSFLVSPHGQVPRGVLERRMAFRSLAIVDIIAAVALLSSTLALLWAGVGATSVAVAYGAAAALRAGLLIWAARADFKPRMHFRLRETGRFVSFGVLQSCDMIISFFAANVGNFAVGRMLPASVLGGYNIASVYALNTPARLNAVVTRVAFPALSSIRSQTERQSKAIRQIIETVTLVNAPVLATLAIVAEPFTFVVFGQKWLWIAGLIQILACVGITRAMGNPMGAILMALDRMGVGVVVNLIKSTLAILVIILGTYLGGVYGAAYSALLMGIVTLGVNVVLLWRLAGVPIWASVRDHVRPLFYTMPLVIAGLTMNYVFGFGSAPEIIQLLAVASICLVTYLVTLRFAKHPLISEIWTLVARRGR